MERPAGDVVAAFFEFAERALFTRDHVEYALNGALKNKAVKIVVAIGSLHMHDHPTTPSRLQFLFRRLRRAFFRIVLFSGGDGVAAA
jgi:hypothetical protein